MAAVRAILAICPFRRRGREQISICIFIVNSVSCLYDKEVSHERNLRQLGSGIKNARRDAYLSTEMQQDRSEVNLWSFKSLFHSMNGVVSYPYSYLQQTLICS